MFTLTLEMFIFTPFVFSQQIEPIVSSYAHKSDYICSRLSNIATPNKVNRREVTSLQTLRKKRSNADCPVSIASWTSYSGSGLVNKLKTTTDYDCLINLFNLRSNLSGALFSNANIQAVAHEVSNISISYDGIINNGIYGLLYYLHATLYQEYAKLTSLNEESKELLFEAMESFADNEYLWNVNETALNIIDKYLIVCDYTGLRHKDKILSVVKNAMRKLINEDSWKPIVDNPILIQKYASAYNRIFFLFFRGITSRDSDYVSAIHKDSEITELLYLLSKDGELTANKDLRFMVNNAVLELARMTSSDVLRLDVETYVADLASFYSRLTHNWYRVVEAINKGDNCEAYNMCEDMEAIRQEVKNMLLPNTYVFDDGKLKIRTSLPYDKAQSLYYASKQVQSQLFRFLQTDVPVTNDPNPVLKMVIYGTPKEYKDWNPILNNLPVNNGGIYIEKGATFYTFERTIRESTFSLEELFRHEYVHYLQGRYIENGLWGRTDFYKNNRLVWFDEGMAEHFAGSTDNEGVRIRKSQGNILKTDGEDEYMTVSGVLSANYEGGFKFYRYGNILWSYWFKYDMATARQLINLVRNDDIEGFDNRIAQLKEDETLQTNYTNYLNDFVINSDNWWDVNTPWIQYESFTVSSIEDIKYEFNQITGINAEISLESSSSIRRFKATFPITTTSNENFETKLDVVIEQLKDNPEINNFSYIAGYYTDVNESSATAIITGSLLKLGVSNNPNAKFTVNKRFSFEGDYVSFNNLSKGYIRTYEWSFPGGYPSDSTEKNPLITYNSEGTYPVILKAVGSNNLEDTESKLEFIKVYKKSDLTYCTATVVYDFAYISNVSFAGINNDSFEFPKNGYSDHTNQLVALARGLSYNLSVMLSYMRDDSRVKVWIDWNQDGDFEDENENVMYTRGTDIDGHNDHFKIINIPADALLGITRMRVRYAHEKEPKKCGEDDYFGEVEDYSVLVADDTDNDGVFDNDQCNNTTSGATVDAVGCIELSSNNFEIHSATPRCPGVNNGKISIKNLSEWMFDFVVTGPNSYNKTFSNKLANDPFVIEDLAVGTYNITAKFSTDGIGKDITGFQVSISNSTTVSGINKSVDRLGKSSVFTVSGDKKYSIYINDVFQRFETFSNESEYDITVDNLSVGENHIKIIPENKCRGLIEKRIIIPNSNIKLYPNPAVDIFHIGGLESSNITVQLFSYNGQLVYSENHKSVNGIVYFSIRDFPTGLYIVRISGKKTEDNGTFKITKK